MSRILELCHRARLARRPVPPKSMCTCVLLVFLLTAALPRTAVPQEELSAGGTPEPDKAIAEPGPTEVRIVGHVYKPKVVPATDERIASLQTPPGFVIEKWADGLGNPRMIAIGDDGTVHVTRRKEKDLLMLRDTDGDGRADEQKVIAKKEPMLHGIAIRGDKMYLTSIQEVFETEIQSDGSVGELKPIVEGLPDGGQHPNRTIAFGPDGMLYISSGSASNAADEPNPEHATMLRADPNDGWKRTIFARGLRNTIGFDWHPETQELWGADHGIDWLGDNEQKEELNRIQEGKHYGWPFVYADGQYNPVDEPPGDVSYAEFAAKTEKPALLYTAHAAPMMMTFYTADQFPEEYRNDAFLAMRGSWNRKPPSGHEIVRIRFDKASGRPTAIEPFVTGFLVERSNGEWERFGRPVGVAVMKDGSLLVGDDTNGVLYRIRYTGGEQAGG